MKASPVTIALVAVTSSLITVGAVELLRGPRPGTQAAPASAAPRDPSSALAPRTAEPLVAPQRTPDRVLQEPSDYEDRLAELERRLAALELGSTSRRTPSTSTEADLPAPDDLRSLVLEWVAEERAARTRTEELEDDAAVFQELEFGARQQAHALAQEHDLADWQEAEFAALFLQIGIRAREIEEEIDLLADNPEELEARWEEYDAWVDELERALTARLDPALYYKIYGDD